MTVEQIRALHAARPFRPFTLILADGTRVHVRHPEFMAHPNFGRTVVVYDKGERHHVIDLLLVTALEVGDAGRTGRGRRAS